MDHTCNNCAHHTCYITTTPVIKNPEFTTIKYKTNSEYSFHYRTVKTPLTLVASFPNLSSRGATGAALALPVPSPTGAAPLQASYRPPPHRTHNPADQTLTRTPRPLLALAFVTATGTL